MATFLFFPSSTGEGRLHGRDIAAVFCARQNALLLVFVRGMDWDQRQLDRVPEERLSLAAGALLGNEKSHP